MGKPDPSLPVYKNMLKCTGSCTGLAKDCAEAKKFVSSGCMKTCGADIVAYFTKMAILQNQIDCTCDLATASGKGEPTSKAPTEEEKKEMEGGEENNPCPTCTEDCQKACPACLKEGPPSAEC